jgi:UDP-N-acetylmuramate dehydrogenase
MIAPDPARRIAGDWPAGVDGVLAEEPLARHSQFGVGGPAQWFAKVRDERTLAALLRQCDSSGVPVTMLGAGSNTLIADAGLRGLVVRFDDRHLRVLDEETVELGGGCMMPRAALDCARRGMAGLEFGIGVPGTCGASVFGNAGAFGTEIADVLVSCDVLSRSGVPRTLSSADLEFAYRHSALKGSLRDHVVVGARFRVHRDDPVAVRARTDAIQAQRKATQPYGVRSLGSVFKNPPGDAAGRLIETALLSGRRIGGAQISPKHANFIVNAAHATAADVLALVQLAHDEVLERFGVDLEREIIVLGEDSSSRAQGSPLE